MCKLQKTNDKKEQYYNKTVIDKACKWIGNNVVNYLDKCNDPTYVGGYYIKVDNLIQDFRKAMEEQY